MVIKVNMDKARKLHMQRIRNRRDEVLAQTDIEFMKLLSQGKDTSALTTLKQELRDLPQTLDLESAETPEQLKAMWPDVLGY